jgi:superfamily II DNA helicase RecQ
MEMKFFRIPVVNGDEAAIDLNGFLRARRVLCVQREFVAQGSDSFWAVAVEYLAGEGAISGSRPDRGAKKVDYKELLNPEEFAVYIKLRNWRKETAGQEAVPVYTVFTNEQLAEIARRNARSQKQLLAIDGIGQGRVERYGQAVIELMGESHATPGEPVPTDC